MIDDKIDITLLTTNKSGTLSSLMMKCKQFGLTLTGNKIEKINDEQSLITMHFEGNLNKPKEALLATIIEHKQVIKVKNIVINDSANEEIQAKVEEHVEAVAAAEPELTAEENSESSFEIPNRYFL